MKEKILMLKSIISDIKNESEPYLRSLFWNINDEGMEEFINKYYSNYDELINKAKIWIELNIEHINYILSTTKFYVESKPVVFDDNLKKEIVESVKNLYREKVNLLFEKSKKLEYLDVIHNVIRKQINDEKIIETIKCDEKLDKLIMNIDSIVSLLTNGLNSAIGNFNNMYLISSKTDEKEHIDSLIDKLKDDYFRRMQECLYGWYRKAFDDLFYQYY